MQVRMSPQDSARVGAEDSPPAGTMPTRAVQVDGVLTCLTDDHSGVLLALGPCGGAAVALVDLSPREALEIADDLTMLADHVTQARRAARA